MFELLQVFRLFRQAYLGLLPLATLDVILSHDVLLGLIYLAIALIHLFEK